MNGPHTVEILGGGLAGLGLALGLRQADVPVVVHEAGSYPRHRVCGEFITSLDDETIHRLALAPHLADALPATSVSWFSNGISAHHHDLPEPARCLSRHALDERLADALVNAGGILHSNSRQRLEPAPGRIITAGRRPNSAAPWLGLKVHLSNLELTSDLELHLGRRAYVGLTSIENQRVNLCGLFHRENVAKDQRDSHDILISHLHAAGLQPLAQRIAAATLHPDSRCAVAGLDYHQPATTTASASLGDQSALIPPFTGHGMTIAFQSARLALDPLIAWSRHQQDWAETCQQIDHSLRQHLAPKIRRAAWLHGWLLEPRRQRLLLRLARARLLPTRVVYHLLH